MIFALVFNFLKHLAANEVTSHKPPLTPTTGRSSRRRNRFRNSFSGAHGMWSPNFRPLRGRGYCAERGDGGCKTDAVRPRGRGTNRPTDRRIWRPFCPRRCRLCPRRCCRPRRLCHRLFSSTSSSTRRRPPFPLSTRRKYLYIGTSYTLSSNYWSVTTDTACL